ncbi:MAG: serpin family protein [Fibrobacteria bacterium]|nr:serpin family protein [Fibrobacteria bacterium]
MIRIKLLGFLSAGLLLCNCNGLLNDNEKSDSQEPVEKPFSVAMSAVERENGNVSSELINTQVQSINSFAVALYKELTAGKDENFFFSPYSIMVALGMADAGAKGETDTQIRQALQVTLDGNDFFNAMNGIDISLSSHAESQQALTLNVTNDAWAQTGWDFRLEYLDLLSRYYGAGVNLLDFMTKPEDCRLTINDYISDVTNEKIKDLLPPGSISTDTRLVLTNAVYFLASWLYPFDKSQTAEEKFTLLNGSESNVSLMTLGEKNKEITLRYAWNDEHKVRIIELPYAGKRLTMNVLLPDKDAFNSFENNLTAELISQLMAALDSTDLPPVKLPKFTFKSPNMSLVEPLKALGMKDAFNSMADFSGIDGKKDLMISDVIHKSFIAVDEAGTEAAAATAVIFIETSLPDHFPSFVADRPFIYCIRDTETGTIIFMGKTTDPASEN